MRTYKEAAQTWGKAYTERERSAAMGSAMALANEVFEAVALAADPDNGLPSQRAVLAGAIAAIQEQARAEIRAEIFAEARSLVAGEIRLANVALEKLASAVQRGDHFVP